MSLEDFNAPVEKPSLSDFFATGPVKKPVLNAASINNVAAYTASLQEPGAMESVYNRVTEELNYGVSQTMTRANQAWDGYNQEADYATLTDVVADPNLTPEQRETAIREFNAPGSNRIAKTFFERTALSASIANSEPDDNDETDFVRVDASTVINKVDEYNGWVQKRINDIDNMNNPDFVDQTHNVVELFLPYLEGSIAAQVSGKLFAEDGDGTNTGAVVQALTLMGDNKAAVRDAIIAMPIDERKEMAEKVIQLVLNSSGPSAFTENDIVMMNNLQSFLSVGGYNDGDKFIDNLFSVLDNTVLLTPFSKTIKGALKVGKATVSAASDAATFKRYESAVKALEAPETTKAIDEVIQTAVPPKTANDNVKFELNEETLSATKDMISDKLVNTLEGLDDAPYEVFSDVRKVVDDKLNATTVNSPTIAKEIVDDVNSILTKKGLTPLAGKDAGKVKASITTNMKESVIKRRYVRTRVQPTSLSQAYVASNPAKARAVHQTMVSDSSGNAAQIMYGTNKTDAVANDVLPEAANPDGSVRNKVSFDEASPTPNKALVQDAAAERGRIEFTNQEKQGLVDQAKTVWRDIQGLHPRKEMSAIEDVPYGVKFNVVYGPKDGGFSDPHQAISQAKFGLRNYGITDDQIEVLKYGEDGTYSPTTDFSSKGNYLIRVKHDYEFSPADTQSFTLLSSDPLWRMFDVMPMSDGKAGGFAQHIIPATAVIPKQLLDAASVAADKTAWMSNRLLALGNDYAKKFKSLDKVQQRMVNDYIIRANAKEIKFNSVALEALGMDAKAVETVRSWKNIQDTLWHFENADVNRTLRARGYMRYTDTINDTDFIARPVSINQTGDVVSVFDGQTVRKISREEIRKIYERGGNLAHTRSPVTYGDDVFEYAIVDNHANGSYLRAIKDTEPTLAYKDGYYSVRYNTPYFITKQVKGKDGKVYKTAIATAENRTLADAELTRLRNTDDGGVYNMRHDLKRGTDSFDDSEWESMVSNGRSAQRVRGQRLRNVGEGESDMNKLHIETPEESLVNSIRSLSNRVAHRDFISQSKARWLSQFGEISEKKNGVALWPSDVRLIGANNAEAARSTIQDARTMWRYIEAIDSGYVNLLDDLSKKFFKEFSDTAGRSKSWKWLEKPLRAAEKVGPTGYARKKAFRILLAANPLRQLPVQAMQALPVIIATNPLAIPRIASQFILVNYIQRGGDVDSFFKAIAKNATGLTTQEAKDLVKHYELSGFEAAVDANTFIRDDMKSLVDKGIVQKTSSTLAKPIDFMQKIGFEAGENMLMRTVWLSEYDKLRRSGKAITAEDVERVNAKARHLTLNMNKAGELPYNENAFSALMQFFQAPHKAFSQIVMGHKGLTTSERLRLGTAYVLTFGIGGGPVTSMLSNLLPDSGDDLFTEVIEGGLFNIMMNTALGSIYNGITGGDEKVRTDFSDSLRLLEFPNFYQFFQDVVNLRVGEILSSSPSASLVLGDNPRITRFVKSLARPFTVNNERKPEEFLLVGKEFLSIFSGASNFFKASYILEHQKQISSTGATVDYQANAVEALMKAGGFATIDEVRYYALNDKTYRSSESWKKDVKTFVTETSRRLASQGISNTEQEYWVDMMAEAQRVYKNEPFFLEEFMKELDYRASRSEYDLFTTLMNLGKYVSPAELENMLRSAPSNLTDDQKAAIRGAAKIMDESNNG